MVNFKFKSNYEYFDDFIGFFKGKEANLRFPISF